MESRDKIQERKKHRNQTGGGKPPSDPTLAQQKILDLCEDTPGFTGLKGVETPASCTLHSQATSNEGNYFPNTAVMLVILNGCCESE